MGGVRGACGTEQGTAHGGGDHTRDQLQAQILKSQLPSAIYYIYIWNCSWGGDDKRDHLQAQILTNSEKSVA